jgi:integrase
LLPVTNPAKTKKAREAFGKAGIKSDVLQRGQLKVSFTAMRQIQNPVVTAFLQVLLLTGARPGVVLTLGWEDVNTKWKGLTIRDKVEGVGLALTVHCVALTLIAPAPWRVSRG